MKYYQVKPQYDNKVLTNSDFLIGQELLTTNEFNKLSRKVGNGLESMVNVVFTSSHNTHWAFGARFVSDTTKVRFA